MFSVVWDVLLTFCRNIFGNVSFRGSICRDVRQTKGYIIRPDYPEFQRRLSLGGIPK